MRGRAIVACALAALVLLSAPRAGAIVIQDLEHTISTVFDPPGFGLVSGKTDSEFPDPADSFADELSASITGPTFGALLEMQLSGLFSASGQQFGSGALSAGIRAVQSVTNDGAEPLDLDMTFVITDATFFLLSDEQGKLEYRLLVCLGTTCPFESIGVMTGGVGFGAGTFKSTGNGIGAVFDGFNTVGISFAARTAELPSIAPGDTAEVGYFLEIESSAPNFAEIISFQFSDPAQSGAQALFTLSERDAVAQVPEPSTLLLFAGGFVVIARLRRNTKLDAR